MYIVGFEWSLLAINMSKKSFKLFLYSTAGNVLLMHEPIGRSTVKNS
jgi:hypothetical protein